MRTPPDDRGSKRVDDLTELELPSDEKFSAREPFIGAALYCWADTRQDGEGWNWQPLVCHGLDAAACADVILARVPAATRTRLAALVGFDWQQARSWLLLLVACHDLGKACPGFQSSWRNLTGIDRGRSPDTGINPAFVGQIALRDLLVSSGWARETAIPLTDAVVCHDGLSASERMLAEMASDERAVGGNGWAQARRSLFDVCLAVFRPRGVPSPPTPTAGDLKLLSDLVRHADTLAADETLFPFAGTIDLDCFRSRFEQSRMRAEAALGHA